MKTRTTVLPLSVLAGALALNLVSVQAGEVVIANFDSDDVSTWAWEGWSDPGELAHDPTLDAGGGNPDGSLQLINNLANKPDGYQQCVFSLNLNDNVDAETYYSHVNLDLRVAPGSTPRAAGDYGTFEIITRNGSEWVWTSLISVPLTTVGEWIHVSAPIKPPANAVHHLTLKLGQNALLGPVTYNIDNLTWTESTTPLPPPTLSVKPAQDGLNVIASTGGQYDRQSIRTVEAGYSWVGSPNPVSYAITLTGSPGTSYPGFQTHMYLVPGTPGNEASPDWNQPTVILVPIINNAAGGGTMTFRWKQDAPNSNGTYFDGEKPAVNSTTILGTWTVTLAQDTQGTLTAPDGTTTSFTLEPSLAAAFAGEMRVYFGIQPNQTTSVGQGVIFGKARITSGSNVLIEDTFVGPELDTAKWEVIATSAASVKLIEPGTAGYWVSWTLPDTGFVLQSSPSVSNPNWQDSTLTDTLGVGFKRLHVPKASLPAVSQGYFRMVKP